MNRNDPLWQRIADKILETVKGQPPVGKTGPTVEPGKPAKPQPRYELQNAPKKKMAVPSKKAALDPEVAESSSGEWYSSGEYPAEPAPQQEPPSKVFDVKPQARALSPDGYYVDVDVLRREPVQSDQEGNATEFKFQVRDPNTDQTWWVPQRRISRRDDDVTRVANLLELC